MSRAVDDLHSNAQIRKKSTERKILDQNLIKTTPVTPCNMETRKKNNCLNNDLIPLIVLSGCQKGKKQKAGKKFSPISQNDILTPKKVIKPNKHHLSKVDQNSHIEYISPKPYNAMTIQNDGNDILTPPQHLSHFMNDHIQSLQKLQKKYFRIFRKIHVSNDDYRKLISWICLITHVARMSPNVVHHAVILLNEYLQGKKCEKKKLQLVACGVVRIAAKLYHRYNPDVKYFEKICVGQYTKSDFVDIEIDILQTCNFSLFRASIYDFLCFYALFHELTKIEFFSALYIAEVVICELDIIAMYTPETIALCCVQVVCGTIYDNNGGVDVLCKKIKKKVVRCKEGNGFVYKKYEKNVNYNVAVNVTRRIKKNMNKGCVVL